MNILFIILGLALLLFGRRLFWLFVALAGFGAGMFLAREQLHLQSDTMVLAIAALAGLLGALLSVFLQKIAVGVAGFMAGAYVAGMLLKGLQAEALVWIGFALGGVLGAILLLTAFEWALVILSSLVGAAFVSDGLATPETAILIFLAAFVAGVVVQAGQMRSGRTPKRAENHH